MIASYVYFKTFTVDDIFGDKTKVCSSSDVQMFIRQRKYTIHPCDQLANQIQLEQLCGIYFATLPPAVEVRLCLR